MSESTEIVDTKPLCWILDNQGIKHYKECTLKELQEARSYKTDILTLEEEVLTDYQVAKYGKADTVDRFLCFALPKYPKKIQDRFKVSVGNMTRDQRNGLSYQAISKTIKKWIADEDYYS